MLLDLIDLIFSLVSTQFYQYCTIWKTFLVLERWYSVKSWRKESAKDLIIKSLVECIPKFPRGINNLRFLSSLLGRMDIARHVGCSRHMGCSRMDIVVSFRSASHFTLGPWGMHRYLRAPLAIQFLSENLLITFIWDTPAHVLCGSQQYTHNLLYRTA